MRHARARERAGERESEREREGRRERPAFSSISTPDMPLVKGGGWSKAIFSTASRMPFLTPSDSARVRAVAGTGSSSSSSKDLKRPFCPSRNASSSSAMSSGCAPRQCQTRPGSAAKELCAQHKRDLTEQKRPTWRGERPPLRHGLPTWGARAHTCGQQRSVQGWRKKRGFLLCVHRSQQLTRKPRKTTRAVM